MAEVTIEAGVQPGRRPHHLVFLLADGSMRCSACDWTRPGTALVSEAIAHEIAANTLPWIEVR